MVEVKKLLLPTDFSECANAALEFAADLAVRYEAEIELLHIIHDLSLEVPDFGMGLSFPAYLENLPEKRHEIAAVAMQSLEKLRVSHPTLDTNAKCHVRFGQPFAEILSFAEDQSIDLIVLGTHGRTGLANVLLGSVAERVIERAACPVLTVRHQKS